MSFVHDAALGRSRSVLNMMFHNVDLIAGCSPNAPSEHAVTATVDDLRTVLEEALSHGGCFATLSEIRDMLLGS